MKFRTSHWGLALLLLAAGPACDSEGEEGAEAKAESGVEEKAELGESSDASAEASASASAEGKLSADALDLESVSFLIRKGKVKNAKALEKTINSKSEKINKVDIDGDGTVDKVAVVEIRDGGKTKFELKVLPSSKKSEKKNADVYVTVAYVELEPVEAESKIKLDVYYDDDAVEHTDEHFYSYEFEATYTEDHVEVADAEFVAWVYTSRPAYVSEYYYVEIHIDTEGCWPPGHCKHVEWGVTQHGHVEVYFGPTGYYKHKKHKKWKKHKKHKHFHKRGKW